MTEQQRCRLCLKLVSRLENSHIFPTKAVYKILRDDGEKNPNPHKLTAQGAVQTSEQRTAKLLCRSCEQRFSKYGENWVSRCCLQRDGNFPLMSVLSANPPDIAAPGTSTRIYYASKMPQLNMHALAYFGASVFWRDSIHPWNADGTIPVRLGPFQEPLRQYLLGEQPFPQGYSLCVTVREGKAMDRLAYAPVGGRAGKFHLYRFPMPGLMFFLAVGNHIPSEVRAQCLVNGPGNPILVTGLNEWHLLKEAVEILRRSRR